MFAFDKKKRGYHCYLPVVLCPDIISFSFFIMEPVFLYAYRQIGKMLNAREPKIINGPQILDKYVGESEKNIRMLFAEAEEEEQRVCL